MIFTGNDLRRMIIACSLRAHVGHIGSALSIADMMAVLFTRVLRGFNSGAPDADCFILAKGHAALAYYCVAQRLGLLSQEVLDTYCHDGSILGVHPEHGIPGVEFSTGSLGIGLSMGVGAAYARKLRGRAGHVYVLVSDAECNEGSLWEAVMFAGHHQLANVTVLVDNNGMQALGETRGILGQDSAVARWRAFGWDAVDVDGHDAKALERALTAPSSGAPRVVIGRTVLGKGVSFMEGKVAWHYFPVDKDQAAQALSDIDAADGKGGAS